MKRSRYGLISLFMAAWFIPALLLAQGPVAIIKVEAMSPQELHDLGWVSPPSTGLKVVGKGELVYLSGHEAGGEEITGYAWAFSSLPNGSNATLDSTTTAMTTFRPDTTGEFVVQLTITTASGTDDTTITIISANYVGVGTIGGATPDFSKGQCGACHADKVTEWQDTGHATMFTEAIDGLKSPYYQERCIECHTVGYDTSPEADNGGFDDVARNLGWVFPDTLKAGNWDDIVTNFPDLAQKANIQCENCHGPGSLHFGNKANIDVTLEEGLCGKCHEEQPYHRKNIQWKRSGHSEGIAFAAEREDCAGCHSGYGFIKRTDVESKLSQSTGFPQISCQVCHDPHSAGFEHQVRKMDAVTLSNGETIEFGGEGKLCMNCHMSRRDAKTYVRDWKPFFGPHSSNQADMLAGTNAVDFGIRLPSSNHKGVVEDACVTCHMAPTPAKGEPGRDQIGEHTFAMHWDGGTPDDPSDDVFNVAACRQCHGDITSFEDIKAKEDYDGDGVIESAEEEVEGLLEAIALLLPPIGEPEVALETDPRTNPNYTPVQLMAGYNYLFVKEDGSNGIHNYQYAVNLLKVTHQALTTGDIGAGTIESITDVPNDQGKQVRIVWTRFGGDGVGNNPIQYYALWRRVDDMGNGGGSAEDNQTILYESLSEVPAGLDRTEGAVRVLFEDALWDFVGQVPAAGLEKYSTIAPTLFDSTKVDGMHWSVFMVSGHTSIPAIYAVSAPDSGYSVDNLAPVAPTNLMARETDAGIALAWDEPVDADFKYFAVYRSTQPNFPIETTEPISKTTENEYVDADVSVGTTYYYKVTAFDFSGNESLPSEEFQIVVTSIAESPVAIPESYVLMQNYPNPFNPTTVIRFGLPEPANVKLVVYNLLGIPIRVLAEGRFGAGYHNLVWDGRNDRGELVGGGTYLYRLEAGEHVFIRKMVLIK